MKTKFCTLLVAALFFSSFSFATIFRVNYTGPQVSGVDFTTADPAVAAASTNDTIQIYPGKNLTVSQLTKKLVFIGMGYFLDKNANLQLAATSNLLNVTADVGANGSVFEGLEINLTNYSGGSLQNILFKRCKIVSSTFYVYNATDKVSNITFSQCYMSNIALQVSDNTTIDAIDFQNCIIEDNAGSFYNLNSTGVITNVTFENCSVMGGTVTEAGNIAVYYRNCIFANEPNIANNDLFDYCTFASNSATHYVAGTSNQFGKAFTTVFSGNIDGTEWDASYTLKSGSPAIGYGRDGSNNPIDAGAYGGVTPYKLSGIPPVPAFYKLTAPSTNASANPYTITFSVRANN